MKKKRRTYIEPKKQKGKQGRILAVCHLDMIFFVSFFVGILWANFIGDRSKNRFFMLNEYYLQQLKYAKLDYNRLFLYILENRLPLFGILLLLSFTVVGILIQILFILYFGVSFGFLCCYGNYEISGGKEFCIWEVFCFHTTYFILPAICYF